MMNIPVQNKDALGAASVECVFGGHGNIIKVAKTWTRKGVVQGNLDLSKLVPETRLSVLLDSFLSRRTYP